MLYYHSMFDGERSTDKRRTEFTVTNYSFQLSSEQADAGTILENTCGELKFIPFYKGFKLSGPITSCLLERPPLTIGLSGSHEITKIEIASDSK